MNKTLLLQIKALLDEDDKLAALCNTTAFLYENIKDINWIGFYLLKGEELVLGPFQGKIACTHLRLDRGVCAFAYRQKQLIVVNNVHDFKTHIACDAATNSELVVPLIINKEVVGVLDIDSPLLGRFNKDDEQLFEAIGKLISVRLSYK